MKKLMFLSIGILLLLSNCQAGSAEKEKKSNNEVSSEFVKPLTTESFKKKIFDYKVNKSWKYEGNLPAIIDFYADWCGPCRMLSPRVEGIAKKYDGKVLVYKVNIDDEQELARLLGIQSIPTLLFIPLNGQPRTTMGVVPNETLEKAVNEILSVKK